MVILARGQQRLLEDLHANLGIVRLSNLVHSYLWWPRLNDEIEAKVKQC